MKKFLVGVLMTITVLPVFAYAPPTAEIINIHDMQMIREQKFRREEINDYNDVKEEKARFEKRNRTVTPVVEKRNFNKEPELTDDNGQIKIRL